MEGSGNSWHLPRDRVLGINARRAIRAFPPVSKATCPHCQNDINLSIFRQHLAVCRVSQHNEDPEEQRPLPYEEEGGSNTHTPTPGSSELDESSDSFENVGSDHLTIRSQFVSVNQSIESQFATSLPLELPKKAPSRFSASRPASGKKMSLSCPICFSEYDREQHVPLVLPACGHTMCEHCMRHIYNSSSMAKCPVCRSTNYEHVRTLPINYALLELNEEQRFTRVCTAHDKEVLAYCQDHELLLCGMCAFEHREHHSFLLTSEEAATLVQVNKGKLGEVETRLGGLQWEWTRAVKEQGEVIESAKGLIEGHLMGIGTAAEEAMTLVKIGKEACMEELMGMVKESGVQEVQNQCATQMHKVAQDLQTLRDRRTHFDQLSIAEKLSTALSFRAENYTKPPSLVKVKEIEAKMRTEVDYEAAIRSNAMFSV